MARESKIVNTKKLHGLFHGAFFVRRFIEKKRAINFTLIVRPKIHPTYYILSTLIFAFAIWLGYNFGNSDPASIQSLQNDFPPTSFLQTASPFIIFLYIFFNNAIKVLATLLFGFFFGLVPIYFLYSNGLILGIVSSFVLAESSSHVLIAGLLPHGIFELTGVIIGTSYGLWLGVKFYRKLFFHEPFSVYLHQALGVYVRVILPLLLFAALVESYITPAIISWAKK